MAGRRANLAKSLNTEEANKMEFTICDECRIAEHSRFKCANCNTQIRKGFPVIRKETYGKFGLQFHSICYYCYKERGVKEMDERALKGVMVRIACVKKQFKQVEKDCAKLLILDKLEEKKKCQ
jgi:hypothetical protein